MSKLAYLSLITLMLCTSGASARAEEKDDKLPLPRFVSIRPGEVNIRSGPGVRYPIKWVIKKQNMPVEIIAEYEDWRKIRDIQMDEGWAHKAMLSGRRTVMVKSDKKSVFQKDDEESRVVAIAGKGTIFSVEKCTDKEFCEIKAENVSGFTTRTDLWGIYEGEKIKK